MWRRDRLAIAEDAGAVGHDHTHDGTWSSASRCTHIVHFSTLPTGRVAIMPVPSGTGYSASPQLKTARHRGTQPCSTDSRCSRPG